MNTKLQASTKTAGKFILWTAIGAAALAVINVLPGVQLPDIWAVIIAAGLKTLATFAATQTD